MKIFIERITNNLVDVSTKDVITPEFLDGGVTIDYLVVIGKVVARGTIDANLNQGFFKEVIDAVTNRLS